MIVRFFAKVFYVFLVAIEFIVSLRFIFVLINANENNFIVSTVYNLSEHIVGVFHGIIESPWKIANLTIDVDALVVLTVCTLAGFVTSKIITIFKPAPAET